jgi:glycosyltransferase involved in cell wall biosynthesis
MIKLSVVIPCFNAAQTIAVQLEALAQQQWDQPWEVVVADNGSTDESLAIVQRYKDKLPRLLIVDASAHRGAAYATNTGVRAASGEALAFCDADDEVAPGWLAAMGDALLKYEAVACRIDFRKLNPAWLEEIYQDHEQQRSGLLKAWYPPYLLHAGGGTLGIRKSLHEAIGGFDVSLLYDQDTDYCFKIQLRGGEIHFVADALLHVRCRHTLLRLFQQARHWAEYTVLLYKYYKSYEITERQPWRAFARQCKNLLLSVPQIHYKAGRAMWVWNFGWQVGRLAGSLKYHVPPV